MEDTVCCGGYKPNLWFNEIKHPAFWIGDHAIPACILPVAIVCSFTVYKTYQWQARTDDPVVIEHAERSHPKEKETRPDAENQLALEETVHHSRLQRYLGGYMQVHHRIWTLQSLYISNSLFRSILISSGLVEALLLFLAGAYLNRKLIRPCTIAAAGWLAFVAQEQYGTHPRFASIGTMALALSCASMASAPADIYGSSNSAIVLLFMELDRHIPAGSLFRSPKIGGTEVWPLCMLLIFPTIHGLVALAKKAARQSNTLAQSMDALLKELGSTMPDLAWVLASVAAFLAPMAVFFAGSGFCSSCLGWNWILWHRPAETPSLDGGGVFGGLLFLGVWCLRSVFLRHPTIEEHPIATILREELRFDAETAAWSAIGMMGLWVAAWYTQGLFTATYPISLACNLADGR